MAHLGVQAYEELLLIQRWIQADDDAHVAPQLVRIGVLERSHESTRTA
jgi:hypothetical protein